MITGFIWSESQFAYEVFSKLLQKKFHQVFCGYRVQYLFLPICVSSLERILEYPVFQ